MLRCDTFQSTSKPTHSLTDGVNISHLRLNDRIFIKPKQGVNRLIPSRLFIVAMINDPLDFDN